MNYQLLNKLPNELLNKIYSYVESNTNQIIKNAKKLYYNRTIYKDPNIYWNFLGMTAYNSKIMTRILYEAYDRQYRSCIRLRIIQLGKWLDLYFNRYSIKNIVKNCIEEYQSIEEILIERNILTKYFTKKGKLNKKLYGTKKAFIQSQKDYIKRKKFVIN
jgi:hypothetical protein